MEISIEALWKYIVQVSVLLASVGALNWGLVGWFDINLVELALSSLPYGDALILATYSLVALGGVLGIASFFEIYELLEE